MSWRTQWRAIANRIRGALDGSRFYIESLGPRREDPYRADKALLGEARACYLAIEEFTRLFATALPRGVADSLDRFLSVAREKRYFEEGVTAGVPGLQIQVGRLVALMSEIDYLLSDTAARARLLSERAFLHLQRSIVADAGVREKWKEAYSRGEVACEKLGGVHLLLHGIWAFKVVGEGEATDLVMGDAVRQDEAESSAEALVLTEWKLVRVLGHLPGKAAEGRRQAGRYRAGVLGGLELASVRYVVLLSEHTLGRVDDVAEGDVVYRHVNIAVDPQPPSKS